MSLRADWMQGCTAPQQRVAFGRILWRLGEPMGWYFMLRLWPVFEYDLMYLERRWMDKALVVCTHKARYPDAKRHFRCGFVNLWREGPWSSATW